VFAKSEGAAGKHQSFIQECDVRRLAERRRAIVERVVMKPEMVLSYRLEVV
jgi:hypothetical protein